MAGHARAVRVVDVEVLKRAPHLASALCDLRHCSQEVELVSSVVAALRAFELVLLNRAELAGGVARPAEMQIGCRVQEPDIVEVAARLTHAPFKGASVLGLVRQVLRDIIIAGQAVVGCAVRAAEASEVASLADIAACCLYIVVREAVRRADADLRLVGKLLQILPLNLVLEAAGAFLAVCDFAASFAGFVALRAHERRGGRRNVEWNEPRVAVISAEGSACVHLKQKVVCTCVPAGGTAGWNQSARARSAAGVAQGAGLMLVSRVADRKSLVARWLAGSRRNATSASARELVCVVRLERQRTVRTVSAAVGRAVVCAIQAVRVADRAHQITWVRRVQEVVRKAFLPALAHPRAYGQFL